MFSKDLYFIEIIFHVFHMPFKWEYTEHCLFKGIFDSENTTSKGVTSE